LRDGNHQSALVITIDKLFKCGLPANRAITELLGVVVKRTPDEKGYEKSEPALIEKLLKLRSRLVEADLGHGIKTKYWDK
jgi:hypothetical protein